MHLIAGKARNVSAFHPCVLNYRRSSLHSIENPNQYLIKISSFDTHDHQLSDKIEEVLASFLELVLIDSLFVIALLIPRCAMTGEK